MEHPTTVAWVCIGRTDGTVLSVGVLVVLLLKQVFEVELVLLSRASLSVCLLLCWHNVDRGLLAVWRHLPAELVIGVACSLAVLP